MRARVTQQLQAILFGTRKRLFMAVNHPGRVILYGTQADKTLALQGLACVWNRKLLKIGVNARFALMFQNAAADPIVKETGGAGVGVVGCAVRGGPLAKNDANQVVWAQRKIARLHGGRNFVVGLGNENRDGSGLRAGAVG